METHMNEHIDVTDGVGGRTIVKKSHALYETGLKVLQLILFTGIATGITLFTAITVYDIVFLLVMDNTPWINEPTMWDLLFRGLIPIFFMMGMAFLGEVFLLKRLWMKMSSWRWSLHHKLTRKSRI